jgi:hypothetical protein
MHNPVSLLSIFRYKLEFHLSELTGTTNHPDMQKIGFFFENWLHWQFEVGGGETINGCFRLHIYLRTNKINT